MKSRFFLICLVLIATTILLNTTTRGTAPAIKPLALLPQSMGEWKMTSQSEFSQEIIATLRPSDYLSRRYTDGKGNVVQLYIGYHDGSDRSGPIHSPKHCLPGSGWVVVSEDKVQISVDGRKLNLVKSLYQKGEEKELFLYWFQLKEKSVTNEYSLKFVQLYNSLVHKRRDTAFVRISLPFTPDGKSSADAALRFVTALYPPFYEMIPK
jgi:EpsI family protein